MDFSNLLIKCFVRKGLLGVNWHNCQRCEFVDFRKKAKVRLLFKLYLIAGKKLAKTEE